MIPRSVSVLLKGAVTYSQIRSPVRAGHWSRRVLSFNYSVAATQMSCPGGDQLVFLRKSAHQVTADLCRLAWSFNLAPGKHYNPFQCAIQRSTSMAEMEGHLLRSFIVAIRSRPEDLDNTSRGQDRAGARNDANTPHGVGAGTGSIRAFSDPPSSSPKPSSLFDHSHHLVVALQLQNSPL